MNSQIEPRPNWAAKPGPANPARRPGWADSLRWQWKPLWRKKAYRYAVSVFRILLFVFPKVLRLALHQASRMHQLLDYQRASIPISVDSWIEYDKRTVSCAKEPETIFWIENFIKNGDVVFDIGANIGAYSLVIAKRFSDTRVVAFEPSYANFSQLCKNIYINKASDQISAMFIALSDTTGMQDFHYSDVASGAALHSLGQGADFAVRFRQPMLCYRLDDALEQLPLEFPNHIKLDVDGIEHAILEGAWQTLADPRVRSVIVETEQTREGSDRITELLKGHGFRVDSEHVHNHNPFNKGPYVRNVIFVRDI